MLSLHSSSAGPGMAATRAQAPAKAQHPWMKTETKLARRGTETKLDYQSFGYQCPLMAQHVWGLVLLGLGRTSVGLPPQRLAFSHSEIELSHLVVHETLDTWRQSFAFAPINLTTIAHILPCVGHRNAFPSTPWKNPISSGNTRMIGWV